MKKFARTVEGMRKRRRAADVGSCRQFNPNNGEPHTEAHLEYEREIGRRRVRRFSYATEHHTGGIK